MSWNESEKRNWMELMTDHIQSTVQSTEPISQQTGPSDDDDAAAEMKWGCSYRQFDGGK